MSEQGTQSNFHPKQIALAQELLGVPLYPEQAPSNVEDDVRAYAVGAALSGYTGFLDRCGGSFTNDPDDLAAYQDLQRSLEPIARHVQIANNVAGWRPEFHDDDSRRGNFQRFMLGYGFERLQVYHEPLVTFDPHALIPNSTLFAAPTGSGKTLLQAVKMSAAGIGTAPERMVSGKAVPMPLRGLLVVEGLQLQRQYLGETGKDTFRRFFGRDIRISPVSGDRQDYSGDIVCITRQSLWRAIEKDYIDPRDYPFIVVDEAHLLLGPQMQKALPKLAEHSRIMSYTATPAYEIMKRDLRNQFEHKTAGTIRQFVEDGILSEARLYSFRSGGVHGSRTEIAIKLAVKSLKEGLKVAVYCGQGDESAEARAVAAGVNAILKEECPDLEGVAAAIGQFQPSKKNREAEEKFDKGELQSLSTVGLLRVGWDADLDVAIFIDESGSTVNVEQAIGRVMRPGRGTAHIMEVLPESLPEGRRIVSIFDIFGLDRLVSGTYIRAREPDLDKKALAQGKKLAAQQNSNQQTSGDLETLPNGVGATYNPGEIKDRNRLQDIELVADMESLQNNSREVGQQLGTIATDPEEIARSMALIPEDLLPAVIAPQPVRYVTVSAADRIREGDIPEGHRPLKALCEQYNVPYIILRGILDAKDFSYIGVRPYRTDTEGEYDRWYGPDADIYLAENPPQELASHIHFTVVKLAAMAGVQNITMRRYLKKQKDIIAEKRRIPDAKNRLAATYDAETSARILERFENEHPMADNTDVMVWSLVQKYGDHVYHHLNEAKKRGEANPILKRPHPDTPRDAGAKHLVTYHLTEAEAAKVATASAKITIATIHDMNIGDIAAVAGVTHSTVMRSLTDADRAALLPKRPKLRSRDYDYLPAAHGLQIAERLRPRELPIAVTAFPVMAARSRVRKDTIRAVLQRAGYEEPLERINLGGINMQSIHVYPWAALRDLERRHPPKHGEIPIDYDLLTVPFENYDERAILLATKILTHYLGIERVDQQPLNEVFARQKNLAAAERERREDLAKPPLEREWIDIEDALAALRCESMAFAMLYNQLHATAGATRHDSGHTYLQEAYFKAIVARVSRIPAADDSWVAMRSLDARLAEHKTDVVAMMKIVRLPSDAYGVQKKSDGTIAVHFKPTAATIMVDTAKRMRLRPTNE